MENTKANLDRLSDVEFWKALCPDLTVSEQTGISNDMDAVIKRTDPLSVFQEEHWEQCQELIDNDGYFAYEQFFKAPFTQKLADCFDSLKAENILPVFCFVYDEFWQLLLHLRPLLNDLLDDHEILPAVWAWFVEHDNQTGFTPHRDQVRETSVDDEDHLDYLTIWIPLSDLNHLSSSICVLPASLDPDYEEGTSRVRVENLKDVRSLQAPKGSVFCWTVCLAHWGTTQSEFGPPRKSVGFYVQRAGVESLVGEPMDFDKPLSLRQRLSIIGEQIIDYSRDGSEELLKLAQNLMAQAG